MNRELEYTFDDEQVSKFCYDLDTEKVEVYFEGYYDLIKDADVDAPCIWTIEDWEYAKSVLGNEQKRYDMNWHIGIFRLILYMKYNDNQELEMLVETLDNRYVTFFFKDPTLSLRKI